MLRDFVEANRDKILSEARERVIERSGASTSDPDRTKGLPVFLDQLEEALRKATAHEKLDHTEIQKSAHDHGHALFHEGLTVDEVVHDYGDLCQVITALAIEHKASIEIGEFRVLNLCLDDAIAGAVSSYSKAHDREVSDEGTERLGILAHEMRNVLNIAILAFTSIKNGTVAPSGSTGAMLDRSHLRLQALIDRSLTDVRLEAGLNNVELVSVSDILEEVAIGASLVADTRGVKFALTKVDHTAFIEADRQLIAAAISNLLQNAFKFTRPGTRVNLSASTTATRVLVEVADECGGLPPGKAEDLFLPFSQRNADRSGLGLGLSISLRAAKTSGGELRVRDVPGHGCVFMLDLPRKPPPPLAALDGGRGKSASTATTEDALGASKASG